MKEIIIPNSVTSIGVWAFYGCDKLAYVKYLGTAESWLKIKILPGNDPLTKAQIQYVAGELAKPQLEKSTRSYSISYHNVSGATNPNPTTYTVNSGVTLRPLSRDGYTFDGWYYDRELTKKAVIVDPTETRDITLWAKWIPVRSKPTLANVKADSAMGEKKPYKISADGKTLTFGAYPQTKVTDNELITNLNTKINGNLPSKRNANGWTDYGYYIDGKVQSYMWYVDVEYIGVKYRGVYFTRQRPNLTSGRLTSNQLDNGYKINTVYWFKWEPITWRILKQENGKALIMADLIIDSQQYYHEYGGTRTINGKIVYPNNYKESDIRKWLNDAFYNVAFDELSKQFIIKTEVDNSASTTDSSRNSYICENTFDNVFLLSYRDVTNINYSYGIRRKRLRLKTTAYAQCQGAYTCSGGSYDGCGYWCPRSPYSIRSNNADYVDVDGTVYSSDVNRTYIGAVPALQIQL